MLRILSSRSLMLATAIALAPFALQAQAAATTCKDGTTSAATGKGACSGHGGVKAAAKATKSDVKATTKAAKADVKTDKAGIKADTKAAKADAKADSKQAKMAAAPTKTASNTDATGATAKCKDGTYSHAASRRGACSKHGGVAEWLKT
ncbi:MAG TPA: DUF3761 domain-containing protein [Gemmatimonadaceae bacterium]|nr:DUF3761 domain-containing protein [Gemmatimonadaceae bacterium]